MLRQEEIFSTAWKGEIKKKSSPQLSFSEKRFNFAEK